MTSYNQRIVLTRPVFDGNEKEAIIEPLETGWLVQGPRVAEFEKSVCKYTGAKFAKAASSCTTALHMALLVLDIGPGDEVLLPSFTYVATANVVEYVGARPVFIDIDLKTFNIDCCVIEDYLQEKLKGSAFSDSYRTKAIIPVHLFGLCADMDYIMEIAKKYKLNIIEDAACALGSTYKGRYAGTFGDIGCFSFHPRKIITTGEGGMLITYSPEIASRVELLRNHGASASDAERHKEGGSLLPDFDILGYNYRMTDLQGAIGTAQMEKVEWIISKRIEKAEYYNKLLKDVPWLSIPIRFKESRHTYQSYVVLLKPEGFRNKNLNNINGFRNHLMTVLEERGVATRQGTHAVHTLGHYRYKYGLKDDDYPNSLIADRLSITLPLYPQMTYKEQDYVVQQLMMIGEELEPAEFDVSKIRSKL